MLTYVINTSENKTFDSDRLFELAGYHKIRWLNCTLNEVKHCAELIYEKQNVLGVDRFRIAVLVDFYSFDRIRVPYGRRGFGREVGVDMSLYMPYIEVFLLDNLIGYLEKRDIFASDFEIYYVQNEKLERYEFLDNMEEQLKHVLTGCGRQAKEESVLNSEIPTSFASKTVADETASIAEEGTELSYPAFRLYCTSAVSLTFSLSDYPYGAEEMTFSQFFHAFCQRMANRSQIRRHYYITTYGGGAARAAFDTLSLSLYLIRMYEREEEVSSEGEMEIIHLDAAILKEVLETAWVKINIARGVAKGNHSSYYSLTQNKTALMDDLKTVELGREAALTKERYALPKEVVNHKLSPEELYDEVYRYFTRKPGVLEDDSRKEFDKIMAAYLCKRDETNENNVEAEFEELKEMGSLKMTDQCPSKEEYLHLAEEKHREISTLFEKVLAAEYIEVDYKKEKERADEAFDRYKKAKACLTRNLLGDVIFLILTLAAVMVPYLVLQLSDYDSQVFSSLVLSLRTLALFGALFVLAFVLQILPLIFRLKQAKDALNNCYLDCLAKERYSFSAIRRRYEQDLIRIEQARYELRVLKHLYEANLAKDKNVSRHREMLEEVEDRLSSMLNNLDVEPVFDPNESVDGEFDPSKSFRARENKIYQIFSIETIERMFPKKGRDEL